MRLSASSHILLTGMETLESPWGADISPWLHIQVFIRSMCMIGKLKPAYLSRDSDETNKPSWTWTIQATLQ